MSAVKLTQGQEMYARYIVEGMNQTEAYRSAYPNNKSADKTIWERASKLAADPKVRARIQELRDSLAKPTIKTAQERLEWLSRLMDSDEETTNDKLRALDIMNKMTGEYTQKVEANVNTELNINIELSDD